MLFRSVRRVVLLHVEHERYVHVLLETQQILDFARALLYEMIESIYHMSYSIVYTSPTRGVPQARRLLGDAVRNLRKVFGKHIRVHMSSKVLLQQLEVDEGVVPGLCPG